MGVNFIGGFSALVQKGYDRRPTDGSSRAIPEALADTDLVCSSVNVGSTKAGINMDAVALMGRIVKADGGAHRRLRTASAARSSWCSATLWRTTPLWPARSTASASRSASSTSAFPVPAWYTMPLQSVKGQPFDVVAETIKKTAFRITRMGQLVAQEASRRLNTPFGIVDLSLAPTPAVGDSVARILEEMGLEVCGTHGTTAALALLNDAVKKGGVMASSSRRRTFRRVYSRQRGRGHDRRGRLAVR